jgi:hypothetical protein
MFVTGCHRSGTSLLASIISHCLGETRTGDLDAVVDNPRGYFESTRLREFNDNLLKQCGYSWDRPPLQPLEWTSGEKIRQLVPARSQFADYAINSHWVDKDPRLCLSYGAFLHILLKPVPLALAIRHPFTVARSLQVRDGMDPEKGLMLWLLYNRQASRHLSSNDLVIHYEDLLLSDGSPAREHALGAIEQFLQQHLQEEQSLPWGSKEIHERIRSRIAPELQRSKTDELSDSPLALYCQKIHQQLMNDSSSPIAEDVRAVFDQLPGWIIDQYDEVIAAGLPSLEFLRQFAYEQALQAPSNEPETETLADLREKLSATVEIADERFEQLQAANEHSRQLVEAQTNDHILIADQRAENEKLRRESQDLQQQVQDLKREIENLRQEVQGLHQHINQIKYNLSWKVTTPLRWLRKGRETRA